MRGRDIRSHREATKVLILTSFADDEALFSAIMAAFVVATLLVPLLRNVAPSKASPAHAH